MIETKDVTFFRRSVGLDILYYLYDNPEEKIHVAKLSDILDRRDSLLAIDVEKLTNVGLIKKERSKTNKRIRILKLTPFAMQLLPHLKEVDRLLTVR